MGFQNNSSEIDHINDKNWKGVVHKRKGEGEICHKMILLNKLKLIKIKSVDDQGDNVFYE